MNSIFKKLNFKGQSPIYVINAPTAFRQGMADMESDTEIRTKIADNKNITFLIAFVTTQKEVDDLAGIADLCLAEDAVIWFAYPKKTSRNYKCEFNRDNGWQELGKLGFEGVRMVAIDEDWSGLRFRKVPFIKTMTRSFAISDAGKKKAAKARRLTD